MPTEAIEFRVNDDTLSGDLFRPKGVLEPALVVQAPVLIIAAERDSRIPFATTRRTAARIRSCQFEALLNLDEEARTRDSPAAPSTAKGWRNQSSSQLIDMACTKAIRQDY
jgi:hypothetical protein